MYITLELLLQFGLYSISLISLVFVIVRFIIDTVNDKKNNKKR